MSPMGRLPPNILHRSTAGLGQIADLERVPAECSFMAGRVSSTTRKADLQGVPAISPYNARCRSPRAGGYRVPLVAPVADRAALLPQHLDVGLFVPTAAALAQRIQARVGAEVDLQQPLAPLALQLREMRAGEVVSELSRSEMHWRGQLRHVAGEEVVNFGVHCLSSARLP